MTISFESRWGTRRVKTLTTKIGSGKTPSGGSESYLASGVTFLRSQNIHFDGLRLDDVVYISEATHREMKGTRVKPGDVLLNITGASLGRVSRAPEGLGEANVNQHVCIIRPSAEANARYLAYALSSQPIQEQIAELQVGGNREGLNFEQVGNLTVPAALAEEQRRIADFLDTETAHIDKLMAIRRSQMALLDERLDSIRDQLFGSSSSDSVSTPLMYLTDPSRPIVYGIVQAGPEVPDGVPYIKTGDLNRLHPNSLSRTSPEIHAQYRRAAVYPKDIVMAMRASIGAVAVVPPDLPEANLTQGTARIAPARGVDGQWLLQALQTRRVREQCDLRAVGSTFRTLNIWDLRRVTINAVPSEKQRVVTEQFSVYATRHAQIREATQRQVDLLSERRQALITAAVTGQFDISTASGRNVTDGVTA